jgi:phosphate transport system permease protein
MTLTAIRSPETPTLQASHRKVADKGFRLISLLCGLLVLGILVLIAFFTTNQAWPAFTHAGFSFFTSKVWDPTNGKYGALAFIYGTLITSVIALVFAVPVSLGIALFLTELAPPRLRMPVVYLIDLLAAIPSVVYGLWGVLYLAIPLGKFYKGVSSGLDGVPVLGNLFHGQDGRSFFTAGLIVALMIIPIITSLTREVFATVPRTQKEAALALGATRWEMMRTSILGYGRSGVVGAVMLGLGRAMGETIAVALVIGSFPRITANLFRAGDAMASVIANQFGEASDVFRAALIALGVVLFAITILINIAARAFITRSEKTAGRVS